MKVYISGPITGTTDYMDRFENAQEELKAVGCEVINPAWVNEPLPKSTTHEEYMHVSFALMDLCEAVYMLDGWDKSKGCRMEFEYAARHGLSITFEGGPYGKQTNQSL